MYIGYGSLCVCLSTLLHGPGCNLGEWYGVPLCVYCWADLLSLHGFRCYDNIAPNAKCRRLLVLALCLVISGRTIACILATCKLKSGSGASGSDFMNEQNDE